MIRNGLILLLVAACAGLAPSPGHAGEGPYRLQRGREWTLLGAGAALGAGGLVLVGSTDPLTPDEISRLDPADVNGFDRDAIGPLRDDHAGDALSVISYLMPLAFFATPDTRRDWTTLGVMWVEATLLNLGVNGIAKATALRERPYAYDAATPLGDKTRKSTRFSFYSGHAASAAVNCAFVATVFSDYVDNRALETALWVGAAVYPAVTAWRRVDTAQHFPTDVITGYGIGAAIGYLVPRMHRNGDTRLSVYPASVLDSPGVGAAVSF
jgi:membrane-associated phospholipid phosphatase